jgi:hypothetical protein
MEVEGRRWAGMGERKEREGKATHTSQTANSTTTRCGATLALLPWCFSLDVLLVMSFRFVSLSQSQPWFLSRTVPGRWSAGAACGDISSLSLLLSFSKPCVSFAFRYVLSFRKSVPLSKHVRRYVASSAQVRSGQVTRVKSDLNSSRPTTLDSTPSAARVMYVT